MLSIVTTLYHSAAYVTEFIARIERTAETLTTDYEIILVNDGSPDDSAALARRLAEKNSHLILVDLSRNFGHHKAMMAGLMHARGNRIFLIDVDLEEPPELLAEFWQRMNDSPDTDVVYGQLRQRKGGFFERVSGELYYSAINRLGGVHIPRNISTVRLMTKRYVRSLLEYREREMFMAGLWSATGYRQEAVTITKANKGNSTYNLARKLSLLTNSIVVFSNKPLLFIFHTGLLISLCSATYVGYLLYNHLFLSSPPSGWTSLMASIWLIGGMIILFLGLIGIYLSKIFIEVKQRPYVTIREVVGGNQS
ncbi:MAG: glycosyltransferase family 2 protein [Luteimonas sp.]